MQVDLNKFIEVKKYLRSINKENIQDITWVYNGKELEVSKDFLEFWRYVGLNNTDFPVHAFSENEEFQAEFEYE